MLPLPLMSKCCTVGWYQHNVLMFWTSRTWSSFSLKDLWLIIFILSLPCDYTSLNKYTSRPFFSVWVLWCSALANVCNVSLAFGHHFHPLLFLGLKCLQAVDQGSLITYVFWVRWLPIQGSFLFPELLRQVTSLCITSYMNFSSSLSFV